MGLFEGLLRQLERQRRTKARPKAAFRLVPKPARPKPEDEHGITQKGGQHESKQAD